MTNTFDYINAEHAKEISEQIVAALETIPGTEAYKYAPEETKTDDSE